MESSNRVHRDIDNASTSSADATCNRSERGTVLVEFSMVVGIFFMMSVGFVDVMRLGYMKFAFQRAVTDAAHWGAVGTTLPAMSRVDSIKTRFTEYANGMGLDVDPAKLRICPLLDPECSTDDAAGPNQHFILRYDHPTMLFAIPMAMTLTSGIAARNEPFV